MLLLQSILPVQEEVQGLRLQQKQVLQDSNKQGQEQEGKKGQEEQAKAQ